MRQKDRNRVQVPRSLPDWMDGPLVRRKAEEWGVSLKTAKKRMAWRLQGKKKKR